MKTQQNETRGESGRMRPAHVPVIVPKAPVVRSGRRAYCGRAAGRLSARPVDSEDGHSRDVVPVLDVRAVVDSVVNITADATCPKSTHGADRQG